MYRSCHNYSDLKLWMGPSESSSQSSRVPKSCGRASEVWSGARSALLNLEIQRAHRVACDWALTASRLGAPHVPNKTKAYDFPGRIFHGRAVGRQAWATGAVWGLLSAGAGDCCVLPRQAAWPRLAQPPADEPMSSIRNLSWPSQWRFQISAQIHPKFELTSQSDAGQPLR
jgi:hypothetical protein